MRLCGKKKMLDLKHLWRIFQFSWSLAPPTVMGCNTTVVKTDPFTRTAMHMNLLIGLTKHVQRPPKMSRDMVGYC